MKIAKGVEWAAHSCALLALLKPGSALSKEALADFIDVPRPYLAKQLQALSRAGIVSTKRGVSGGYWLALPPDEISLWDITAAVDGDDPSFRCTEVRQNGPCGASLSECSSPCSIAAAFGRAEAVYRDSLASVSLTDIITGLAKKTAPARKRQINEWVELNAVASA